MRKNLLDSNENDGEERLVTRALESRPSVLNDVSDCDTASLRQTSRRASRKLQVSRENSQCERERPRCGRRVM